MHARARPPDDPAGRGCVTRQVNTTHVRARVDEGVTVAATASQRKHLSFVSYYTSKAGTHRLGTNLNSDYYELLCL